MNQGYSKIGMLVAEDPFNIAKIVKASDNRE